MTPAPAATGAAPADVIADWSALRSQALLGTDRQPAPPPSPVAAPVEAAVLAAAVVGSARRRAGARPRAVDAEVVPAPPDPRPPAPDRAGQLLELLLDGQVGGAAARTRLLELWLEHCAAAGMVAPHRALPRILDHARRLDPDLVRTAIGARGRWLAERNPAWALRARALRRRVAADASVPDEAALVRAAAGPEAASAIAAAPGPWSHPASTGVLSALARRPRDELRPLLEATALDLGSRLDPSVAPEVQGWRGDVAPADRRTAASLGLVLHVLSIRTELRELFPT